MQSFKILDYLVRQNSSLYIISFFLIDLFRQASSTFFFLMCLKQSTSTYDKLPGFVLEVKFMLLHVPKCVFMLESFLYPIFSCTCFNFCSFCFWSVQIFLKHDLQQFCSNCSYDTTCLKGKKIINSVFWGTCVPAFKTIFERRRPNEFNIKHLIQW